MHPHDDSPFTGGNFRRTFCILGASIGLIGPLASCVGGEQGPMETGVPLRVEATIAGSNETLSLEGRYLATGVDGGGANDLELCGVRRSVPGSEESVCLSFSQDAMRALTMEIQEQGTYRLAANGKAILHTVSYEIVLQSDPVRGTRGEAVRGHATNPESGVRIDFTVFSATIDSDMVPAAILAVTMLLDPDRIAPRSNIGQAQCQQEAQAACAQRGGVKECRIKEEVEVVKTDNGTVTSVKRTCTYTCEHDQGGGG